ncbi:uncharacterized protein DUF3331 [Paraburkholderia sp. BL6665CI2N2]|uniref:DUF3331 domain-containing protein n=1 Tax=Paraburkholderia sp. BL6665CI2N2 TaxID=1938806 RepID=UPI001066ECC7|nr:DUF3331 domain-containing protein [Paraburkholderia sp. BL6665CI2N2]TDY22845.1 uncharacterized protein DUF3331 [Paraburkholderia sp. BL6665CI2N2]
MHIETPLTQRTDTVQYETRVRCGACCQVSENAPAMPDDRRAPVWDHVINRLLAGYCNETEGEAYLKPRAKRVAGAADTPSRHIQIEILERLSDTSIAVLWRDATRCQYVDQVWICCRARIKGRCALSGATIRRDDAIYKPRIRSAVPANADAMILASVIACVASTVLTGDSR